MASKDEYYQRIIASLQADIKSQNSAIFDLKSTVAGQQKEIEALKASQCAPQHSAEPHLLRLNVEKLLVEVKRVCDQAILTNYEHLPTMFADRQEFDNYRKSSEKKFLYAETFTSYKKSLETRLKSIEAGLRSHYSFLTINRYDKDCNRESKSYFNLDAIIKTFKNDSLQWLKSTIVCIFISLLALYLISTITT